MTRNTNATGGGNTNTKVAFKNCAPFRRCVTHINDEHVETAKNLDIIMPMYNLLEYSDNYADSSGSLWQFKRHELNVAKNPDVTTANSLSFKYKSSLFEKPAATGVLNSVIIAVPLKYLSNFFRSLEVPIINCKIHLELNWTKNCVMSTDPDDNNRTTAFQITSTKLYVPIVTLSTKDNLNLTKQLNEGFKRSVYWNEYKSKKETRTGNTVNDQNPKRYLLDASFVLAFNNVHGNDNRVQRDGHKKILPPKS